SNPRSFERWAGGSKGYLIYFNGFNWSQINYLGVGSDVGLLGFTGGITGISVLPPPFGTGSYRGWMTTSGGIYHLDKSGDWALDTTISGNFASIKMGSFDKVWAVGFGGSVAYYNGTVWQSFATGTPGNLYKVDVLPDGSGWAVGDGGVIIKLSVVSG